MKNVVLCYLGFLLVAGCGGAGESSTSIADFVGTWRASAGSQTVTCTNGATSTSPATDTITIAAGTTPTSIVETDQGCVTILELEGDVAMAAAGQSCSSSSTPGATLYVDAETFTTSDGVTASDEGHGRLDGLADPTTGAAVSCNWQGSISYTRIAR